MVEGGRGRRLPDRQPPRHTSKQPEGHAHREVTCLLFLPLNRETVAWCAQPNKAPTCDRVNDESGGQLEEAVEGQQLLPLLHAFVRLWQGCMGGWVGEVSGGAPGCAPTVACTHTRTLPLQHHKRALPLLAPGTTQENTFTHTHTVPPSPHLERHNGLQRKQNQKHVKKDAPGTARSWPPPASEPWRPATCRGSAGGSQTGWCSAGSQSARGEARRVAHGGRRVSVVMVTERQRQRRRAGRRAAACGSGRSPASAPAPARAAWPPRRSLGRASPEAAQTWLPGWRRRRRRRRPPRPPPRPCAQSGGWRSAVGCGPLRAAASAGTVHARKGAGAAPEEGPRRHRAGQCHLFLSSRYPLSLSLSLSPCLSSALTESRGTRR